jgi:hypothetical protein
MRFSIGGCVANRPPTPAGKMKKALSSLAARRSFCGRRARPPEIYTSARASALGRPVMSAAPRSAANSRYRDSACMSRNEMK